MFPGPRIPDVLNYVFATWNGLQQQFASAVSFANEETKLTDNLCEALEDPERRRINRMDCDFQPETWELRRGVDGAITRVARADIRVILGAPGTPHLVMEFKKLDGRTDSRWRYCFDGMSRFVEGKYAQSHAFGVMFAFCLLDVDDEAAALSAYIAQAEYALRLCCMADATGSVITAPSSADRVRAHFDTNHGRPSLPTKEPIRLVHALLPCALPAKNPQPRRKQK